jgi:hypothetical protein
MQSRGFRRSLLQVAAPRLKVIGFTYDDSLRDRSIEYGFSKQLAEDRWARITFQRHQQHEVPYGYGFTVNVAKFSTGDAPRTGERDTTSFNVRLPHLIVDAFGLRLFARRDYWWEPETDEELGQALTSAVEKLERYARPILDDSEFQYIVSDANLKANGVFRELVGEVVTGQLAGHGYEPRVDPVQFWSAARAKPHQHFVKTLNCPTTAYVTFQEVHGQFAQRQAKERALPMQPFTRYFSVRLARKASTDPNAELSSPEHGDFQGWLGLEAKVRADIKPVISRAAVWEFIEAPGVLYDYDESTHMPIWTYPERVRESLIERLGNALEKIKAVGIPLLESKRA